MSTASHVTQRKNRQQTNLSDLTDEVLDIIFDHLDVPDLKDVSLVCRRWCNLAFTRHRISRVVFVPKLQGDKDVLQSKRNYRHAYLFNPSQNLPYVIDLMHAFNFPEYFPDTIAITQLSYQTHFFLHFKDSDGELLQLPKIFPGLEKLDLYPLVVVRNSTVERIHKMIPKCRINVHKGSASLNLFNDAINDE